jgi:hypothetical protein
MRVIITASEIPKFWEAIKYAVANSDMISGEDVGSMSNHILYLLLSGKASCMVRISDDRMLQAVFILQILEDLISGKRTLFIRNLYSFSKVDDQIWAKDLDEVVRYAKSVGCKTITCMSNNEKVFRICEALNFNERFRSFVMEV